MMYGYSSSSSSLPSIPFSAEICDYEIALSKMKVLHYIQRGDRVRKVNWNRVLGTCTPLAVLLIIALYSCIYLAFPPSTSIPISSKVCTAYTSTPIGSNASQHDMISMSSTTESISRSDSHSSRHVLSMPMNWWLTKASYVRDLEFDDLPFIHHPHDYQAEVEAINMGFMDSDLTYQFNAAIIYLISPLEDDLMNLERSIELLWRHFYMLHPHAVQDYPLILFCVEGEDVSMKNLRRLQHVATTISNGQLRLRTSYVNFSFPPGFNPDDDVGGKHLVKRSKWGYHHMIRWWSGKIFQNPLIASLDYYMRLDTDSFILSPMLIDPFRYMYAHNIHYGYRMGSFDGGQWSRGIYKFVLDYIRDHIHGKGKEAAGQVFKHLPHTTHDLLNATGRPSHLFNNIDLLRMPQFWNNFEIVHVPRFREDDIQHFLTTLDESYKIYTHRWGDAPTRFITVALFLDDISVHHFCNFAYLHSNAFEPNPYPSVDAWSCIQPDIVKFFNKQMPRLCPSSMDEVDTECRDVFPAERETGDLMVILSMQQGQGEGAGADSAVEIS